MSLYTLLLSGALTSTSFSLSRKSLVKVVLSLICSYLILHKPSCLYYLSPKRRCKVWHTIKPDSGLTIAQISLCSPLGMSCFVIPDAHDTTEDCVEPAFPRRNCLYQRVSSSLALGGNGSLMVESSRTLFHGREKARLVPFSLPPVSDVASCFPFRRRLLPSQHWKGCLQSMCRGS